MEEKKKITTNSNEAGKDNAASRSEWQDRHDKQEQKKEEIRQRIKNATSDIERAKQCFIPAKPTPSVDDGGHKNVAVYARVSTTSTEQVSSIENQTLYYTKKIESTPNWDLQEIYSDEGKSGTSMRHRDEFRRMIKDAGEKKMDMIICASVSRFARNISDCLEQVSALKTMNPSHPIGVFFETENIYTLNPDSDQALSIHALLADWESGNKSRRMILSYDQRILTGQYPVSDLLGYRHTKDGNLVIVEEEAKTVRFVFLAYINGYSYQEIADILTKNKRPTMRGRTDWNANMVRNVMQNERRWGELKARKTIVIDYKHNKTAKNNNERCSAYVKEHHEPIVSPQIARAAEYLSKSGTAHKNGVCRSNVITTGSLKGFINVNPSWGGVNCDYFSILCRSAYEEEELSDIFKRREILDGNVSTDSKEKPFDKYYVSYGIFYLNNNMPTLTFEPGRIKLNKRCHERMGDCSHIEIYYHPILQCIVVREGKKRSETSVAWVKENSDIINEFSAKAFTEAVYEIMEWRKDYRFKFRGITKKRGDHKIIFFFLDEPQILLSKEQKEELENLTEDVSSAFISYKDDKRAHTGKSGAYARFYPAEWTGIGIGYSAKAEREKAVSSITDADIQTEGVFVENPLIGKLPSYKDIQEEISTLMISMGGPDGRKECSN